MSPLPPHQISYNDRLTTTAFATIKILLANNQCIILTWLQNNIVAGFTFPCTEIVPVRLSICLWRSEISIYRTDSLYFSQRLNPIQTVHHANKFPYVTGTQQTTVVVVLVVVVIASSTQRNETKHMYTSYTQVIVLLRWRPIRTYTVRAQTHSNNTCNIVLSEIWFLFWYCCCCCSMPFLRGKGPIYFTIVSVHLGQWYQECVM